MTTKTKPIRECTRLGCVMPPTRSTRQHCTECHETFGGTYTGDRHRVGPFPDGRRCLTPDEMLTKGWHRDDRGTWHRQMPPAVSGVDRRAPEGT